MNVIRDENGRFIRVIYSPNWIQKGNHISTQTEFKKGSIPWNKGLKGVMKAWNKGLTKETDERVMNYVKKSSISKTGIPLSEDHKKKLRITSSGNTNALGYRHSIEERVKIGLSCKANKHWNWKGGKSKIAETIRKSILYKLWRESVFLRDKYICQNPNCKYCHNKIGGKLNAHHKKSFANYPELRFDLSNGITYCKEYHNKLKKAGSG